jgi:hypothetical protein
MIRQVVTATLILTFAAGTGPALADSTALTSTRPLQQSIARIGETPFPLQASRQVQPRPRPRGTRRQHIFERIGAGAGLLAGGYLGVKIEGDRCHCDDPGLAGFLIGASIGAVVGGVIGFKLGR